MKKKGLIVLLAMMLVVYFVGCQDRSAVQEKTKATEAADQAALQEKAKAAESEKIRQEVRKKEEAARAVERRERIITDIKVAFGIESRPGDPKEPDWKKEVRIGGGTNSAFALSRGAYDRFYEMKNALYYFEVEAGPLVIRPRWEEIGISQGDAEKMYRKVGLEAAKNMLETFKFPRDVRTAAGYFCEGEGGWRFDEGHSHMEAAMKILADINAQPKDIGTSTAAMRQFVLNDFRAEIDSVKADIKSKRVKEADGWYKLKTVLRDAIDGWHFSAKELNISNEELAKARID